MFKEISVKKLINLLSVLHIDLVIDQENTTYYFKTVRKPKVGRKKVINFPGFKPFEILGFTPLAHNNIVSQTIVNNLQNKFVKHVLHEIGHYLAVPPPRRNRKDYGIPIDGGGKKYQIEELKATIIENYFYQLFGFGLVKDLTSGANLGNELKKAYIKEVFVWWENKGIHQCNTLADLV